MVEAAIVPFAATINDAVKMSGIGRTRLYELIKGGEIKAKRSGNRTLVMMDSVRAYVQRLPDVDLTTGAGSPS